MSLIYFTYWDVLTPEDYKGLFNVLGILVVIGVCIRLSILSGLNAMIKKGQVFSNETIESMHILKINRYSKQILYVCVVVFIVTIAGKTFIGDEFIYSPIVIYPIVAGLTPLTSLLTLTELSERAMRGRM